MRWPFRRRDAPSREPSADAQETAAPTASPAWESLPPLQRTLDAPIELTAPNTAVIGDLSQRWSPGTVLEPLGHELGALAPAGTIGLSGPPVEGGRSGPELVDRPRQPRPAVQRMAAATTGSSPEPTDTLLPSGLPPSPPLFHAPVVEAPAPGVQRSLTSASDPVGEAASEAPVPGAATDAVPSAPSALAPDRPAVIPVQREPTSVASAAPVRRLGLGAPLAGGRGGLPIQRAAEASATASADSLVPADRPARLPVQRLALDELPVGHPAAVSRASRPPSDSGAPDGPVVPAGDREGAPVVEPALPAALPYQLPAAVLTGSIDVSRLAGDEPRADPVRVLARPLAGLIEPVTTQRDADGGAASPPEAPDHQDAEMETNNTPDVARMSSLDRGPLSVARRVDPTVARPVAPADAIDRIQPSRVVARSAAEPGPTRQFGMTPVTPLRTSVPRPAAAMGVQRTIVPDGSFATPNPSPLPLVRTPGALPASSLSAGSPIDLQRTAGDAAGRALVAASAQPMKAAEPAVTFAGTDDMDVPIQRAADDSAAGSAPVPVATSTPGGGTGGGAIGGSEKDLDELARRLYGRIRGRLSRELLADRERAGLLTDLR